VLTRQELNEHALALAAIAGLCSSVLTYALDFIALRTMSPRRFGVLTSVQPVFAVVAGVTILHQVPSPHQEVGVLIVATINVIAVGTAPHVRSNGTPRDPKPSET
jgi:inner membrane transporter RhtA